MTASRRFILSPLREFRRHGVTQTVWMGCRPTPNVTSVEDLCQLIPVPTTSCGALVKAMGRGYFMKIDIGGYEMECIQSVALLGHAYPPDFVSVEGPPVQNIEALALLGYKRFKLQSMIHVLRSFYKAINISAMEIRGASGPWGDDSVDIEIGRAWGNKHEAIGALGKLTGAGGDWYELHAAFYHNTRPCEPHRSRELLATRTFRLLQSAAARHENITENNTESTASQPRLCRLRGPSASSSPPYIANDLPTACYGLKQYMLKRGIYFWTLLHAILA